MRTMYTKKRIIASVETLGNFGGILFDKNKFYILAPTIETYCNHPNLKYQFLKKIQQKSLKVSK